MLTAILVGLLVLHATIHLMGAAKGFGLAELPQLSRPLSGAGGAVWLAAAVLVGVSATLFALGHRAFWMVGALALLISEAAIASAWRDAWAGTFANLVLLALVAHGALTEGPWSFHAEFRRTAAAGLANRDLTPIAMTPIAISDLTPIPEPVRRYLHFTGVVGQPRVASYRLRFRGRIRSAPDAAWMPFEAEQQSFTNPPTRLFLMRARMKGLPVEAFHRLADGHATMRVKVLGAFTVADAAGETMDRSETVTLFNDMCLLAPGTLLDPAISWESVDAHTVRARFMNGAHTIAATLTFDDEGRLTNFVSDDRSQLGEDGKTFTPRRFSTPVRDYRAYGPLRLASFGEARYLLPEGEFTYGEFELLDATFNVR
jgi:hypothetical protein